MLFSFFIEKTYQALKFHEMCGSFERQHEVVLELTTQIINTVLDFVMDFFEVVEGTHQFGLDVVPGFGHVRHRRDFGEETFVGFRLQNKIE